MNKKHWNTVILNEDVDDQLLKELIDHSYFLVFQSLPKKIRDEVALG
jgi:predicted DNA-binding protein (MmcQ/YjbR family)